MPAGYRILAHRLTYEKCAAYIEDLRSGTLAGGYLGRLLPETARSTLTVEALIELLLRTKRPQIFAESAVHGDGRDWSQDELSILGDISVAVPVVVYDNGRHSSPVVHDQPFAAGLVFTPGALLDNGQGQVPADWEAVTTKGEINLQKYTRLYERRLVPALAHIHRAAQEAGKQALVTIPGLGCGQFAGRFRGQLGDELKHALAAILASHSERLAGIRAVYYDPYRECQNERHEIGGISLMVRPLAMGNQDRPQLCRPVDYQDPGDDFSGCMLFSVVAWDHVSWPGNDFYTGSRATDDGVKAAATDAMRVMTGVQGSYDARSYQYRPPRGYRNWEQVVLANGLRLEARGRIESYP